MMKTIKLMGLVALGTLMMTSCKKGEDDPFLSLKSRDGRITGSWELKEGNWEESESYTFDGTTSTYLYSATHDGSTVTEDDNGSVSTYSHSEVLDINKDGSYLRTSNYENDTYENQGDWWWISDDKKKSSIQMGTIYNIDRLTNKELVISYYDKEHYEEDNYTETYIESGTIKYEKKK